eukprot:1125046-Prorocentrum_minimum.AAC.1
MELRISKTVITPPSQRTTPSSNHPRPATGLTSHLIPSSPSGHPYPVVGPPNTSSDLRMAFNRRSVSTHSCLFQGYAM